MLFSVIFDAVVAIVSAMVIVYALSLSFYLMFLSDGEHFSFEKMRRRVREIAGKEKECLKK